MPYVPGNATEGYCPQCQEDTIHTVLEVDGMQVRRARCEKCRSEGPLRVAKHKTKAALQAALKKKAQASGTKVRRVRKAPKAPAAVFRQHLEGKNLSSARPYSTKLEVAPGDLISHKRFGLGVVTAVTGPQKAEIVFEDTTRVMVVGRK